MQQNSAPARRLPQNETRDLQHVSFLCPTADTQRAKMSAAKIATPPFVASSLHLRAFIHKNHLPTRITTTYSCGNRSNAPTCRLIHNCTPNCCCACSTNTAIPPAAFPANLTAWVVFSRCSREAPFYMLERTHLRVMQHLSSSMYQTDAERSCGA